jgi:5'-3' exonuclease
MSLYALVDGDVIVHLSCPSRRAFHDIDPDLPDDEVEYSLEDDEKYLSAIFSIYKNKMNNIVQTLFVDKVLVAVKSESNFRYNVSSDYKSHRINKPGGEMVAALRRRVLEENLAVCLPDYEADDQLRIWAETLREMGDDFIVVTIDKDLKMIGGNFYNPKSCISFEVLPREAAFNYYQQILMGDAVDNIKGIPKIGPKKSEKILDHCRTHKDFKEAVDTQYIMAFGDNWMQELEVTGKLIHLSRFIGDQFNLEEWFDDRSTAVI